MGEGPGGGGGADAFKVPAALDGERIDRALALITGLSRRQVNTVLDDGRVALGRRTVTSRSRKVHAGERLTVTGDLEPPVETLDADAGVEVPVVYEDDQVIVVHKPAGMVVHPGNGNRSGTLVHGLLARYPELAGLAGDEESAARPGIVHRLDKGTSGLLVVARTAAARDDLVAQLAARTARREYLALVLGTVEADGGLVDAPLGRSDSDPGRIRVQTGGRPARTRYAVVERFASPVAATLVRCRLETGRTHQIRVHLASIGHPVAGDDRYGGGPRAAALGLRRERPFLHAATLGFVHPGTGEPVSFDSPLPADLAEVLSRLS